MKKILIAGQQGKTINYERAVRRLGAEAETSLHVPNTCAYDGLILPGGGDIDPKLFGQLPKGTRFFDPELDRLQLAVLKAFVLDKKPVLGICKGMQLVNIYFGGDIVQHLAGSAAHEYKEGDQLHGTAVTEGFLEELYGKKFVVNSAHHQGVDRPGQGIEYVQFADDGVVEALRHKQLPVLGVQWHPERLCFEYQREGAADGARVFSYFLGLI
ncbi:MAG: gamma-glutamyl-gamma-aminobutyrate hydrolase family protein [Clostridium sp.]|nr:gamma-glutamyl-gamma-aminobutyrate hydrolase family protein [Clostridium sp.]